MKTLCTEKSSCKRIRLQDLSTPHLINDGKIIRETKIEFWVQLETPMYLKGQQQECVYSL